ncbi:MAG: class I SAM-dependent methyltransferase, partial [Acidimicrobiales bacterium]
DAHGVDASSYALEHAAPGAAGRLEIGDLGHRLPSPDGGYDVVSVLETLEHLPPEQVGRALAELRRVCGGYLVATIPSFGENHNGPGGWFEGKVRGELVERYRSLGPGYEGPVTRDDLMRDAEGRPIEGHLTIASFAWWTRRFEEAGFARCGATERLLHPHLARFGLTKYWNLYVLRVPGTQEPVGETRSPEVVSELEARWGLDRRPADEDDLRRVAEALGP